MKEKSVYQCLIAGLRDDELATASRKLDFLLCDVMWASSSEFLASFGSEMERIKQTYWDRMSESTQSAFAAAASIILRAWPMLKL
jgi:hypothetical protein